MPEITREAVEAAARHIHTLYDTASVAEQIHARETAVDALNAALPHLFVAERTQLAELRAALETAEPEADPVKYPPPYYAHVPSTSILKAIVNERAMLRKLLHEVDEQHSAARDLLGCIWLYVNWRYLTKQMTTEQKEMWADAVDDFGDPADREPKADRWWRA